MLFPSSTPARPVPSALLASLMAGPLMIEEASYWPAVMATLQSGGDLGPGPSGEGPDAAGMSVFTGRYDQRSRFNVTDDGTAIVGVKGLLVNRGGWLGQVWGMTSYEGLAEQLRRCASDSEVRQIVLDIDSGGGMVAGIWDLIPVIRSVAAQKPVAAIANAWACSAAYAIGSAADTFVANLSSTSGSIGVVRPHYDATGALEKWGYKVRMFKAGRFKTAGSSVEPLTAETEQYIQSGIDAAYDTFVAHVAEHRGLSPDAVRSTEARVYDSGDAKQLGLVDEVMSFEDLLEHVRVKRPAARRASHKERPMTTAQGQQAASLSPHADLATTIGAVVHAMRAPAAQQVPATTAAVASAAAPADMISRAEADTMARAASDKAVADDRARTRSVLALKEAKGHEARAVSLAQDSNMSLEQIQAFLSDLPATAAQGAGGYAARLSAAMQQPGASAGVKPDAGAAATGGAASAGLPSLADSFSQHYQPKKKRA